MGIKNFGKEVVIAIPVPLIIQWHDKEVTSLQSLQPGVTFLLAGDSITL
jgi:hypothetical protein